MADNSVFITGAADGALVKALDGLPGWATENTVGQIERILKKSFDIQSQTLSAVLKKASAKGSISPEEVKKVNDALVDVRKNLGKESKEHTKRQGYWQKEKDNHRDKQKQWDEEEKSLAEQIAQTAIMATTARIVNQSFSDNFKTYTDLNAAGINLMASMEGSSNGFQSLMQLTAITGVRFTELAATMKKYSSALNSFSVGKFGKTIAMASGELAQYGFDTKEAAELLGSMMESQMGYTDAQNQTTDQAKKRMVMFGERLFRLSLATGQSRQAILANMEAISKSTEANVLNGQVGSDAAQSTLEFVSSFENQNVGKAFLKMMTDQIKPLNATFMSLQKVGMGGFGQKLMNFSNSLRGMDPESARQAMATFELQNRAELEHFKQQANLYSHIPELAGDAAAAAEIINGIQQAARKTRVLTPKELEDLRKTNKARAEFSSELEKLLSTFQKAFGPTTGMLETLTKALKVLNGAISFVVDGNENITSWIGAAVVGFTSLVAGIVAVSAALAGFRKVIELVKYAFGKKKTGSIVESMAGNTDRDTGGRSKGGRSGGGILSTIGDGLGSIGKGIGGLGRGVGSAIQGLLVGLANGLSALGNPKVILGTVSLGLMSGALWVAGKAVQQFVNLNWETMAKAGVTLVALGIAGAAAGNSAPALLLGAAAFAALGAAIWLVGKGIESVGSGVGSFGKAFDSIATGISSLSDSLGKFTGMDTLKEIVATINKLELLKVAAFVALGKTSPASLPAMSPAPAASVTPRSNIASPSATKPSASEQSGATTRAAEVEPGIGNSQTNSNINNAMALQNSLLEQILNTANSLVSVNNDILRYTRAKA